MTRRTARARNGTVHEKQVALLVDTDDLDILQRDPGVTHVARPRMPFITLLGVAD